MLDIYVGYMKGERNAQKVENEDGKLLKLFQKI